MVLVWYLPESLYRKQAEQQGGKTEELLRKLYLNKDIEKMKE